MSIQQSIERLLKYAVESKLIDELDVIQKRNELLDLLKVSEPFLEEIHEQHLELRNILHSMLDYCVAEGLIEDNILSRDLMDTRIMGIFVDRPSTIIKEFWKSYQKDKIRATDDFYSLAIKSNYIREDRIKKNLESYETTEYGDLRITINLSKPEIDAKTVEKMRSSNHVQYPKCFLCKENVGYSGRMNHSARQNLRVIPITLNGEIWYFQYSPYVYYNEHCIVFSKDHRPMHIDDNTFRRLMDFVDLLPHYFIGSNAGLPIIGGSILSHDHYQGGRDIFPIEKASYKQKFYHKDFNDVTYGIIHWPMGTVRMESKNREQLLKFCSFLYKYWCDYEDKDLDIIPYTKEKSEKTPHNGISPVVRKVDDNYVIHMVFRNNRTSSESPNGIFHQRYDYHHIKKENIGIIETLGQAILPGRLEKELNWIEDYLVNKRINLNEIHESDSIYPHVKWIEKIEMDFKHWTGSTRNFLNNKIAERYVDILKDVAVFKPDEDKGLQGFINFLESSGGKKIK